MAHLSSADFTALLFLAVCSVTYGAFCDLDFIDCGSPGGKLQRVQIDEQCSNKMAVLKKGTNVKINFTFTADAPESKLTSKVFGQLPGLSIYIPFPLANPDACKELDCPIKANTPVQYLTELAVLKSFPAIKAIVKWELQDGSGKNVFCTLLKAEISN